MILQDSSQLETARMFAAVVLLSVLAIVLFGLIALLQRAVVRWK
jgi:ABC-type nitrate/sulfonate/bicarbonate transport system permease component